ncbi:MAG: SusD/RagB family nutrient-binding outer membrane lipoprotein, partial [Alistipes sp.]|nr:SusD/RagB family nutrient-binding outer membrane lipoprotein [Alistipes sp.]
ITDKTISNFLAKVPYNNTVEQIINQKYVALFWVGYESWYEYRRTGFPKLKIGTATSNDHVLPTRFQYPDNTANVNVANYQAQLERLRTVYKGDDDMKTPVWWSKQAAEAGIE